MDDDVNEIATEDYASSRARSHMQMQAEIDALKNRLVLMEQQHRMFRLRDFHIYLDHVMDGASLRALARRYGLHHTTISRIVAAVEDLTHLPWAQTSLKAIRPDWEP